jgi:hypothetical protein
MSKVKVKITESQMNYLLENGRLSFIKNQFGVISNEEWNELSKKDLSRIRVKEKPSEEGGETKIKNIEIKSLMSPNGDLLALYMVDDKGKLKVRISEKVFDDATNADPTAKKIYLQWILSTFVKMIKENDLEEAIRFIDEDLPQASEYLEVFDKIKNTKLFKQSTSEVEGLPEDPTNINQYHDLAQLYKAVDPFIEREVGQLENDIKKYVNANRAKVLYQDSNWLIYQPLDRDANCIMTSYASWCTAKEGNSMFQSYTSNNKEPGGNPSKIYVIINKAVLKGQSDEVYQFHFETEQYKDRTNGRNIDLYEFFQKNPKLGLFFDNILKKLAIEAGGDIKSNKYLKTLMALGEVDNIFDFIDTNSSELNLSGLKLPKLPNELNKFKNTVDFNANEVGLTEIPSTIGDMDNLEFLLLRGNKIKSLPDTIGKLKNIRILNLKDNQLDKLPETISNLDPDNGGSLFKAILSGNDFRDSEKEKIQKLLPNVAITF